MCENEQERRNKSGSIVDKYILVGVCDRLDVREKGCGTDADFTAKSRH